MAHNSAVLKICTQQGHISVEKLENGTWNGFSCP